MKRNLGSMAVWLLAACLLGVMPAQAQEQEVYVTVSYMKVAPGQGDAYVQFEKELWMPVHQERVNAGNILGWYLYGVQSPSGTEVHHNYAVVTVFGSFEAMENSYPEGVWEKVHPDVSSDEVGERTGAARDLVRGETWQLLDQVPETPLATPAPYITVGYMKVPPGGGAQYMELEQLWKKIHQVRINEETLANWGVYGLVFPGGSATEYNYATVSGYGAFKDLNDFDFAGLVEKAGLGLSVSEVSGKTQAARDMVRIEVWYLIDHVRAEM